MLMEGDASAEADKVGDKVGEILCSLRACACDFCPLPIMLLMAILGPLVSLLGSPWLKGVE